LLFLDAADTDLKFKSAKLWITNNYLIEKILVVDFAGNLFTLQFSNISIPNRLDDSLFTYNEPNYKVIDLR
jgi:outer membrane lipoprotein-sorting protein